MAITYKFICSNCKYKVELMVGLSKMAYYRKDPDVELASCSNCNILTTSSNKHCPDCNTKAETGKWFSKKTVFKILDSSMISRDSKISCPKCNHKSLEAIPIVFYD